MTTLLCILLAVTVVWFASAWLALRGVAKSEGGIDSGHVDIAFLFGPVSVLLVAWFFAEEYAWRPFIRWARRTSRAIVAKWKAYRG